MGTRSAIAVLVLLSVLTVRGVDAQQVTVVRTGELRNRAGTTCLEEVGVIRFRLTDMDYVLKYVLRYPRGRSEWTGRLVVGIHGETGAVVRYGRQDQVIGTHETQLDDMIGQHALDTGHAYASFERGVGGRDDALRILYGFQTAMAQRLASALERAPSQVYLVGWSTGGTLVRYAAEDTSARVHGVVIVAGVGGNPALVTHKPLVPQIEIVATADTAILQYVREYRDGVRSESAGRPLRVYEVDGAKHLSSEDDDIPSFARGKDPDRRTRYIGSVPYFAIVHTAVDLLDQWVTRGVTPPPDQVVTPPATIRTPTSRP